MLVRAAERLRSLDERAKPWFEDERVPTERQYVHVVLDMDYVGQNCECLCRSPGYRGPNSLRSPRCPSYSGCFSWRTSHLRLLQPQRPGADSQLPADGGRAAPSRATGAQGSNPRSPGQPIGSRKVSFAPDAALDTPIYRREHLAAGSVMKGPAVIEQMDTTTLVFPRDVVRVDDHLNLLIDFGRMSSKSSDLRNRSRLKSCTTACCPIA